MEMEMTAPVSRTIPRPLAALLDAALLDRARLAPRDGLILAVMVLALGVWGDILFNGALPGLNVGIWMGSLVAALLIAARRTGTHIGRLRAGLLLLCLTFAAFIAWR